MKKSELRKIFLGRQAALTSKERYDWSAQLANLFFHNFDLDDVRYLHLFLSIAEMNEIDTSFIINNLWGDHINVKTIVPRVNPQKDFLEHLEFNSDTTLKVSKWGIAEPVGKNLVDEKKIDLVLVPMLCFDKRGFRVGHGKGFYDKFLSGCREDVLKIGLSFFQPVREIEDVKDHDVGLDYCITPERIWIF